MVTARAGWAVVWKLYGQAFTCDFVEFGDAAAFARGLAEGEREDVLVSPMEVELSEERAAALQQRIMAAIRAGEAEDRIRALLESATISEAAGGNA